MKKSTRKKIRIALWCAVILAIVIAAAVTVIDMTRTAPEPSVDEVTAMLYDKAESLAGTGAGALAEKIVDDLVITVSKVEKDGGECKVSCTVTAHSVSSLVETGMDEIRALAEPDENGETMKSDEMKAEIAALLNEWYADARPVETELTVLLAASGEKWQVFADEDFSNAVSGGLCSLSGSLSGTEHKAEKRLLTCIEYKCETDYPDTRNELEKSWDKLTSELHTTFVAQGRWRMYVSGLCTTLQITLLAGLMGIVLGFVVAIIRVTHDKNGSLGFLDAVCKFYLTVIRGTPVLVQLMIIYFALLGPIGIPKVPVAIIAFGINSGAYVAEIVRGGIMSIDPGQVEAGRSLGLSYTQTMVQIVLPQAFKNVLPSLANEFIVLLKETSVSAYIALEDLTRAGEKVRGATYLNFTPLIAVAITYLAMVMILSYFVGRLERRLAKSDRR